VETEEKKELLEDERPAPVIRKDTFNVLVLTARYRIEGTVHLLRKSRLSDLMNRTDFNFLPLTDVVMYDCATGETVLESRFLCLNKSDITVVTPKEGE